MTETLPIRVMHVIDDLVAGGAQQLLVELAQHAHDRGICMDVVSIGSRRQESLETALRNNSCDVRFLTPAGRRVLFDRSLPRRLSRMIVGSGTDVVHTHLEYSTILGVGAARRAAVPCVVTLHNVLFDFGRGARAKEWAFDRALRHASFVVACGDRVADAHAHRVGGTPMQAVANPITSRAAAPDGARAAIRRELRIAQDACVVTSVGRITVLKGVHDLLTAFAQLDADASGAHLVIVGSGPDEPDARKLAQTLGVEDRVRWLGHRNDVTSVLAASDVFASASHREGLPLAALEAMDAGVAVVATDVGDVGALLGDGRGVLVAPHAPAGFAVALEELLRDGHRRSQLGEAAQRHVRATHDPQRWADAHRQIYDRVAKPRTGEPTARQWSPSR